MPPSLSILGCGWLGRALGAHLVEQGVSVCGSTTTPEKQEALRADGISPVLLRFAPEMTGDPGALFDASVLVLTLPPPRDVDDVTAAYTDRVQAVVDAAAEGDVEWILFTSSTGVYPNVEQTVTEADGPPGAPDALPGRRRRTGRALLAVEQLLMDAPGLDATIVRLGGLYGPGRPPGRFLAGRSNVSRPEAPVNLIHQTDAVGVLTTLIEQDVRGEVFNACADAHPTRREFYTQAAKQLSLEPPTFDKSDSTTGKTVSNQKLKNRCGYTFAHPDPLADVTSSR